MQNFRPTTDGIDFTPLMQCLLPKTFASDPLACISVSVLVAASVFSLVITLASFLQHYGFVWDEKTESKMAREFTQAAQSDPLPKTPQEMTPAEVDLVCRLVLEELLELQATVRPSKDAKRSLKLEIDGGKTLPLTKYEENDPKKIADQADALVDVLYFVHNAGAKSGLDLSAVFRIVHEANMRKRDPKTGVFARREDGKIIKPEGWTPPDVLAEIMRQRM